MNKGFVFALFIGVFLMLAAPVMAQLTTVDLIADGGSSDTAIVIGTVVVDYDGANIIVTINVDAPWNTLETHVAVATSLDEIPQNKNGSPKVGNFPYESGEPIPLTEIGAAPGDTIYVAAQAAVENPEELVPEDPDDPESPLVPRDESAWGKGEEFNEGRDWSMYFTTDIPTE